MAKVMVSLPDELLRQLDLEAQQRGTTRSGLLRDYVADGLGQRQRVRAERIRKILAEPVDSGGFGGRGVELLREEREKRTAKLDSLSRPHDG